MKQFRAFVIKEFYHILRDKRTILVLLGMPVALIFLLGFAMSVEIQNVNIAYMTNKSNESVRRIVERIDAGDNFTVTQRVYDIDQAMDLLKSGNIEAVIRFEDDKGIQVLVDASNPNTSASKAMFLQGIIYQELISEGAIVDSGQSEYSPTLQLLYNPRRIGEQLLRYR